THDMRDNSSWTFSLPAGSDIDNDLNDLVYRIVEGPSTGTLSSCLSSIDFNINRDCTYTAPRDFHGTVTIKYIISDGSDQSETQGLITINVEDQSATEPTLSPFNFISGGYTTHSLLAFTSSSCHDVSAIIIQETATPPAIASPAWQSCATTNGAITFNPQEETPPAQGSRTLYVFAKDAQNNLSSAQTFSFIYDTKPPVVEIAVIPTLPSAEDYLLSWKFTEDHSSDSQNFIIDLFDGSSWSHLSDVSVTNGPHIETNFSYENLIPNQNITGARFRITYTDLAGQQVIQESISFNIVRPVLGSTPSNLTFPDTLNLATETLDFNFTNSSIVASKVCSTPEITGPHAADFSISLDSCTGNRITASG